MRQYSGDRTVLMGCSVCSEGCEYPGGIRYCSDRLWRCPKCDTGTSRFDYERAQTVAMRVRDQQTPLGPLGPMPVGRDT